MPLCCLVLREAKTTVGVDTYNSRYKRLKGIIMLPFKTIAMTSLMFACGSVSAMQALDDTNLSQATGQDGLTVTLQNFAPNAQIIWTDTNGINSADGLNPVDLGILGAPQPGSVVFGDGTLAGNFRASSGTTTITIDADGGTTAPVLNIGITLPSDLVINTGDVFVAAKDSNNQLINKTKIMNDVQINLGGLQMNAQLGNAPQGQLLKLYGTISGGIQISNLGIIGQINATEEYGFGIQKMTVRDTAGAGDLTFNGAGASITNNGIVILPSAGKQVDVLMDNVKVGNLATASNIGGIAVLGLKLGGSALTISGH